MSKIKEIRGYKVFKPDWTCRGYQYTCPGIFEEDVELKVCESGFHFCLKASDCFNYYNSDHNNKVAEVIALGKVDYSDDGTKCCTNKIQIVREVSWDEVQQIANIGANCTGVCNTGNCNTGDRNTGNCNTGKWNTGDWNTGDCNTGDRNTGNCNTGDRNTGDWNTGDCNTGNWNTGNCNTGNRNTGDWNKSSFNSGCFNTIEPKVTMFNKPSNWSFKDWWNSDARYLMNQIPKKVVEWIYLSDMRDEEKAEHPEAETTGGYLKVLDKSECGQLWWGGLTDQQKNIIRALPNFDADVFYECTGIKVNE